MSLAEWTASNWLALLLTLLGAGLGAIAGWRRNDSSSRLWLCTAAMLAIASLASLIYPDDATWGWNRPSYWIIATGVLLLCLHLLLGLADTPIRWIALGAGIAISAGIGRLSIPPATAALNDLAAILVSVRPLRPWWLALLGLIPVLVALSFRSLAALGPVRRWIVVALRCCGLALLAFALAEAHAVRTANALTVLFVWDHSGSVVSGSVQESARPVAEFISACVANRGPEHSADRTGLVVFARWPWLELPPERVPRLTLDRFLARLDRTHTDIGAAIRLAVASFPEGTDRRIVLISDGNENLGDAREAAKLAHQNNVQIDVISLAPLIVREEEVLVEHVEVLAASPGQRVPLRVVLRNHGKKAIQGELEIVRTRVAVRGGKQGDRVESRPELLERSQVLLPPGLHVVRRLVPALDDEGTFVYEARFFPSRRGGDRLENNMARSILIARGGQAILLVESKLGQHQLLVEQLRASHPKWKIVRTTPALLPSDSEELALLLSRFDSVILANLAADQLSQMQQKIVRGVVREHGCGLVFIGGPNGYGAGGWQDTPIEKALPVTCNLTTQDITDKAGLVLIMHGTEMARGEFWQRTIAKLAIQKLSAVDMVGIVFWDFGGHRWHVPFQQVGANRQRLFRALDNMMPGDMPDAEPALKMARRALADPRHELARRLVVFISDGDHWQPPLALLNKMGPQGTPHIPVTTVCITTHGREAKEQMALVAKTTGGRFYFVNNPNLLPQIYMKEVRTIAKSFIHNKPVLPRWAMQPTTGPVVGLPAQLPPLGGFVRTKPRSSPLVSVPIVTEVKKEKELYPILAYWPYGMGKVVAFTSDARTRGGAAGWDRHWAGSPMYRQFWAQLVEWSLRSIDDGKRIQLISEYRNGKVLITADVRDEENRPVTRAQLQAGITYPDGRGSDTGVRFRQVSPGKYQAEVNADQVGTYLVHVRGKWKGAQGQVVEDGARSGVSVPYPQEFAEFRTNERLLQDIAATTGGRVFEATPGELERIANEAVLYRSTDRPVVSSFPIWQWLILAAGLCFLADVAIRRIAIDWARVWSALLRIVPGVRRPPSETGMELIERLKNRKQQVAASLDKEIGGRRFEAEPTAMPAVEGEARPLPPTAKPPPQVEPAPAEEEADFAARLLEAKKKIWEERDRK